MELRDEKNRYFHITNKKNLDSILDNGLIAQIGERSAKENEEVSRVYLFPKSAEMDIALANWFGKNFKSKEDIIILQLDLPPKFPVCRDGSTFMQTSVNSEVQSFSTYIITSFGAFCYNDIPAKYISEIYTLDNIEYKKLISPKLENIKKEYREMQQMENKRKNSKSIISSSSNKHKKNERVS